jgi:hypothetical protein
VKADTVQGLRSGEEIEEGLGREGSGLLALGSEIPEKGPIDEGDETVGISKSGLKVDCVDMRPRLGGASCCDDDTSTGDGVREFCAGGKAEGSSKYS